MGKVSVIIPVYKVEPYIERCARSLFEQTLDDIEFIFVNDCTPDRSMEILTWILEDYPSRKKQVKIINMPENSGLAKVREVGLKHVTGDYIIHCDSDDWVDITMYEKMWKKATEENCDMVLCGFYRSDEAGNDIEKRIYTVDDSSVCPNLLIGRIECYTWNKMIRREMYGFIRTFPKDNMMEDAAIIIPMAFHCRTFGFVDETLYHYFINTAGLCKQQVTIEKVRQIERNFQLAIDHIRQNSCNGTYRRELFHMRCRIRMSAFSLSRKEYLSVCPDITFSLPFDRYTPLKDRLGHISKCLGIHDVIRH